MDNEKMKQRYISPEITYTLIASAPLLETSIGVIGDEDTDEMLTKGLRDYDEYTEGWGNLW